MPVLSARDEGFLFGKGARVVCLGDSITETIDGYVNVMRCMVSAAYPERAVQFINAGISGNKAPDMLARFERDVIAQRPNWVTISVGINDVWHGLDDPKAGVSVERYEECLAAMIDALRESTDAQIALIEPTLIGEEPDNNANILLKPYVAAMARQADHRSIYLIPMHAAFMQAIRAGRSADQLYRLTTDGVHLNDVGNTLMALTLLYELGFGT